jgi:molybdate transport system substrate-binding protein
MKLRAAIQLWSGALLGLALVNAQARAQEPKDAKELSVAAAADLQPVMPAFQAAYEKKAGVKLKVSFASSSVLATQIVNGAPFDVFLAADYSFPEKVVAAGLAAEPDPVPYARGTLVLWARKDSPIQPLSMDLLTDPRVTRVAVADEFKAPYGAAAYAAMRWMKTLDTIKPKLVVAENIAGAAQFVVSGNAQVGFISLTSANSPQMKAIGNYVLVPFIYPKIRQCAVVMKNSPKKAEAVSFLEWMTSPEVQEHMQDFGLTAAQ